MKQKPKIKYQQKPVSVQDYDQTDEYQLGQQNPDKQTFSDLPVQQSQSDDEILQKIDNLLVQNQNDFIQHTGEDENKKRSKKQLLLNFKINELQKVIRNLNQRNNKLNFELEHFYTNQKQKKQKDHVNGINKKTNQSNSNILNSSTELNPAFNDELTQMQGDCTQIELLIHEYKEQLAKSEQKWNMIKEEKDEEIQSLKKQIILMSENNQIMQSELNIRSQAVEILRGKNQELLIEIENIQNEFQRRMEAEYDRKSQAQSNLQRYYPTNSPRQQKYYESPNKKFQQFQDNRFNEKIQKQMENMIKKLLKELSKERKVNSRMSFEIKRLNNEVIELQKKVKHKNDNIYELEMKIIYLQKSTASIKSYSKYSTKTTPLTPSHKKNTSRRYPVHIYDNPYRPTSPQNKRKFEEKQMAMNQYQHTEYVQYSEQENYGQNSYQDYVLNSIPTRANKTPKMQKPAQTPSAANIKNQIFSPNGQSQRQRVQQSHLPKNQQVKAQQPNFIRAKRRQQKQFVSCRPEVIAENNANKSTANGNSLQFMTFTVMQLQDGKMKITIKQKIIIISKLIQVYCKKIKTRNYYNLIAEEIQVYNFSEKHPNLVRIKIIDAHSNSSKADISSTLQQQSEQSLMYNMAFIVENLVRDVQTLDRQDLQVDLNLNQIIEQILAKSIEQKISYFQQLSRSLQASVSSIQ